MKKQYKLLVETANFPKGIIIESEDLETPDEEAIMYIYTAPDKTTHLFKPWQVENRPTVWQLIEEEKVENEYLPFFPALGQKYWFISSTGKVESDTVCGHPVDTLRVTNSVVFRTEQGARYEALRRESMSKRWKPKNGERYFAYDFDGSVVEDVVFGLHSYSDYFLGNCHQRAEEARKYGELFGKAWEVLL